MKLSLRLPLSLTLTLSPHALGFAVDRPCPVASPRASGERERPRHLGLAAKPH